MERLFMKLALAMMVLFTLAIPSRIAGQTTEPDQTPPTGSPTNAPPQAPTPSPVPSPPSPAVDRPVSFKLLLPNLISDQKRIWSFPARLVQGQSWTLLQPSSEPPLDSWRWIQLR